MILFFDTVFAQAHDVVAHEVYGEEAVRVTPPSRSDLLILNNHLSPNKSLTQLLSAASI